MATDIIKKFWDKLSRRHDNLGRDDSFYALFSNGFSKAKIKLDHITRVVVREYDEETLKKIEDGLVAIDTIVRNPKQFLKVDDEIIPVELAKKVNQDSIKHLSSHSHLINRVDDDGMVMPTRILTGLKDDTINLYENRFVRSLIINLVTFFDRRFSEFLDDVDFSSMTKLDNKTAFVVRNSQVNLDLQMTIVTDNFNRDDIIQLDDLFRRVAWIKHTLAKLYDSDFMKRLNGEKLVVGEIKRTNTIKGHPQYNICYHLWNHIMNYQGMVLDFRVEEIPIVLSDKYKKKMNKALMYLHGAVDACQKDNEKYVEALNKSLNLNIKQGKVKLIKDTIDRSQVEVVKEEIDKTIFKPDQQKLLDKLYSEKVKLETQLSEMKERHREKEKENREMEANKKEFIVLKEREIKELERMKQYAKDSAVVRAREKKEKEIAAEEARKVAVIRNKKYDVVSKLVAWQDKKKISERSIEKANGSKVLLNREIKAGIRVEENMAELKKIEADIILWNKTIEMAKKKRVELEQKESKLQEQIDKVNAANKIRREKRRTILREKNNRLMSQYEDLR